MNLKKFNNYYLYLAIIFIGLVLRLYYSSLESYWFDEQISFYISDPGLNFQETLQRSNSTDYSPFLFNFLLKIWFTIFGYSPDIGRYFSVFCGIISIFFLTYISFIIFKKRSFIITLFLSSFNIFLISYSAETRPYSTIFLLSIINIYFFIEIFILKNKNKRYMFLFILFSLLTLLSHPFTILILGSQVIFLLIDDLKNKKIIHLNYFIFSFIIFLYLILEYKYLIRIIDFSPPEFFIKSPSLDFYVNFYFSHFFGSRLMGIIYLLIFIFLLINNRKKIFNSKFYLFLMILLVMSYATPIIYGYIFNPILKDRYIIFVLVPITLLISNLVYEIKNKDIKRYLIAFIFISIITNQFFEIYNKNIDKPDFKSMIIKLNSEEVKNIGIITLDKKYPYMTDINQKDRFRERNIIKNYVKQISSLDNKFVFFNQEELPINLKEIWLLCYETTVRNQCEENIRVSKEFQIKKRLNSYQLKSFLLKK